MTGIIKKDTSLTATRRAHSMVLFNVVWNGCYLLIEHGMPLMIGRSYVSRQPSLAWIASRNLLGGGDKS